MRMSNEIEAEITELQAACVVVGPSTSLGAAADACVKALRWALSDDAPRVSDSWWLSVRDGRPPGGPGRRALRIYVAGPYTKPDPVVNTRKAIEAGDALMQRGYAVFIPHLTLFWHLVVPHPWEIWFEHDIEWLSACDAVLLLPGESRGAEGECAWAGRLGIPVYRSFEDLTREMPSRVPAPDNRISDPAEKRSAGAAESEPT